MTSFEQMFDHGLVSVAPVTTDLEQLRARIRHLERGTPEVAMASAPALGDGALELRRGGSYEVTDLGVAMSLLAGPTGAGEWCAVVGVPDFGVEAAVERGVDLARTVLVPDPGEQWLEVAAVLVDVVSVVLLRPDGRVGHGVAARFGARLRKSGAAMLVHGEPGAWPRCDVRLDVASSAWSGPGRGHGRLRSRQVTVRASRGARPGRMVDLQHGVREAG